MVGVVPKKEKQKHSNMIRENGEGTTFVIRQK